MSSDLMKKVKRSKSVGRPKTGQTTYSTSLALTLKEREFLHKFPNSSGMVRKMLDAIIEDYEDFESKFPLLVLKQKIDLFQKDLQNADAEFHEYSRLHAKEMFVEEDIIPETGEVFIMNEGQFTGQTKPATVASSDEARYHYRIWQELKAKSEALAKKVEELKKEVIGFNNKQIK